MDVTRNFCDTQQILFVKQNPPPHPPVFNGQYQDGWNTNLKPMKNAHPFCIIFQVLKVATSYKNL